MVEAGTAKDSFSERLGCFSCLFQLSDLLKISGLGKDVAEKLRLYILDKAGASVEDA